MLEGLWQSAVELIKLSPRYLSAVVLATAALLFLPERFLLSIGLNAFVSSQRHWIGLTLVGSTCMCLTALSNTIWTWIQHTLKKRSRTKRVLQRLEVLTEGEKQILRFYHVNDTRSNRLRFDDGIVQGLVEDGVLYAATTIGNLIDGFDYNITELAWTHIRQNPSLLVGHTDTMRTDRRRSRY